MHSSPWMRCFAIGFLLLFSGDTVEMDDLSSSLGGLILTDSEGQNSLIDYSTDDSIDRVPDTKKPQGVQTFNQVTKKNGFLSLDLKLVRR